MEILCLDEIVNAVNGRLISKGNILKYKTVSTDSRKIEKEGIFIALRGDNFNGNDYALKSIANGAALCIVDEIKFELQNIPQKTSIILVKDGKKALMDLAKYYRSRLKTKIIGITGSTGKTSTKDLTAAALKGKFKVFKTEGNFNNEIGLPLMLFKLDNNYDIAVLEMGMSHFGEIHNMADAGRPDLGIITNIGISHIENLKTQENILKAKMEITDFFDASSVLIVNGCDKYLESLSSSSFDIIKTGISVDAKEFTYSAYNIILNEKFIEFDIDCCNETEHYHIDMPGRHNVLNAMLAVASAKKLGLSYKEITEGFRCIEKTSMRLDIIRGEKFTVINDSYNASPDSMKAALDVLHDINCKRRIAVLGTMMELGDKAFDAHEFIGRYAAEKNIDLLITLGEYNGAYENGYGNAYSDGKFISFNDYDEVLDYLKKNILCGDAVLVKASRAMKFENIASKLIQVID